MIQAQFEGFNSFLKGNYINPYANTTDIKSCHYYHIGYMYAKNYYYSLEISIKLK